MQHRANSKNPGGTGLRRSKNNRVFFARLVRLSNRFAHFSRIGNDALFVVR